MSRYNEEDCTLSIPPCKFDCLRVPGFDRSEAPCRRKAPAAEPVGSASVSREATLPKLSLVFTRKPDPEQLPCWRGQNALYFVSMAIDVGNSDLKLFGLEVIRRQERANGEKL
jgi:hypothetical protein